MPSVLDEFSEHTGKSFPSMPNPSLDNLKDPLFNAIWETIKTWDINVPLYYNGYCSANGSHAKLIFDAIFNLVAVKEIVQETGDYIDKLSAEMSDRDYDDYTHEDYTLDNDEVNKVPKTLMERIANVEKQLELSKIQISKLLNKQNGKL
jgi:hypothetical protein